MGIYSLEKALSQAKNYYQKDADPWDIVSLFEEKIAKFTGSKYAVALDSCTNALFLCLKYLKIKNTEIEIPNKTYLSVPQTIIHSGNYPIFRDYDWSGLYRLGNTAIFDSAGRLRKNMYLDDTYMCLSFHLRKVLPLGKGGMILLNSEEAYDWMQMAVYEGRNRREPHDNIQDIVINGWNMYMTPEQAAYGLELFENTIENSPPKSDSTTSEKYVDLSNFSFLSREEK